MFSFFRRGKSKDDSEKKEKSKDKSFSPFSKRDTNRQEQPAQKADLFFRDSSLTPGPSDIQTPNYGSNSPHETLATLNGHTETHHTNQPLSKLTDIPHVEPPKTDDSKDEQQYFLNCKYPRTVIDSTISSPAVDVKELSESPLSERAGSSDRDVIYKTAPNTPVLPKHLTVTGELVIDTPDLVSDCPNPWSPLGEDSDFPCADGEESSDADSNVVVLGDLQELDRSAEESRDRSGSRGECASMCEEMSHGPGELYDIAEEETSEDEEESEQEEDDEDDDDEDSGNVTQPTIEEEYPEEIVKYVVSLFILFIQY